MIKRIELKNFMSHEHTVIEPAEGLTVLIGPNNVGKSAVIAALQILCYNDNSTYVLRHGTKECSISVETCDGHTIEWKRKKSPSYIIDGQKFDRLARSGIPDELHQALKLPKVEGNGTDEFDVHFGSQKSPIFLLDESGATAARFFASSSDAIRLVAMQQRHKERIRDAKKERTRLDLEAKRLNAELSALDPAVEIERRVEKLEDGFETLKQLEQSLSELSELNTRLEKQEQEVAALSAEVEALGPLEPPPLLVPIEPLDDVIQNLHHHQLSAEGSIQRLNVLNQLPLPPEPGDVLSLHNRISEIENETKALQASEEVQKVLRDLNQPPELPSTENLQKLVGQFRNASQRVACEAECHHALSTLQEFPAFAETQPLQSLIKVLSENERNVHQFVEHTTVLKQLTQLELDEVEQFARDVSTLEAAARKTEIYLAQSSLLKPILPPEISDETNEIEEVATQLKLSLKEVQSRESEVSKLNEELENLAAELKVAAAEQNCPVCGGAINVEKLLEQSGKVST